MARLPRTSPLPGVTFETAVAAIAADPGFVAIDAPARLASRAISSDGKDRVAGGRYSIVASSPAHSFAFTGGFVTVDGHTAIDTPRTALEIFLTRLGNMSVDPYLPFSGGAIGYVSFEGARALGGFEPARGFSRFPQCQFGIYETAAIFDRLEGTAFIVANGESAAAADRAGEELKERLEQALPWAAPPMQAMTADAAGASRQQPERAEFEQLLKSASDWLRADLLSRIHLTRHTLSPATGPSAVDRFLLGGEEGAVRALFVHEGAAAIVSSREPVAAPVGADPVRALIDALPAAATTGDPLPQAVAFLCQSEGEHRRLYGGAFGTLDAQGMAFRLICGALCDADGAISRITGFDLTVASDPSIARMS